MNTPPIFPKIGGAKGVVWGTLLLLLGALNYFFTRDLERLRGFWLFEGHAAGLFLLDLNQKALSLAASQNSRFMTFMSGHFSDISWYLSFILGAGSLYCGETFLFFLVCLLIGPVYEVSQWFIASLGAFDYIDLFFYSLIFCGALTVHLVEKRALINRGQAQKD